MHDRIVEDRRLAIGVFALLFVTYAWFFGGGGWNQNAHFDLTRAVVERQTFHIDGYRVNSGDVAWSLISGEAHAYSNKPPGLPFLAAIPYAVLHKIESARFLPYDSWFWMTANLYVLQVLVCATSGAGIAVLMFFWTRRRAEASQRMALFVALIGGLATIVFPYSTAFFSPVPAAFFLLLAFVALDERPMLAGAAAGMSGVCYYYGIIAAAIFAIVLWRRHGFRPLLRFVAGGLPFGALLAWYHTVCFGAPWKTSLHGATNFIRKDLFLGFFRLPSSDALWGLTFSEYRGLFFVSPVLLVAFVGLVMMMRRRMFAAEASSIVAIMTAFLFATASFHGWEGGGSFGPRHILPAVPLFALPIAFARGRALIAVTILLATVSAAIQFVASAVNPTPPGGILQPVRKYYLPVFLSGRVPADAEPHAAVKQEQRVGKVSVNRQGVDELVPHSQHRPGSRESEWAAFNLGEFIFGTGNRTSVLPIALWLVAGIALLVRAARPRYGDTANSPYI